MWKKKNLDAERLEGKQFQIYYPFLSKQIFLFFEGINLMNYLSKYYFFYKSEGSVKDNLILLIKNNNNKKGVGFFEIILIRCKNSEQFHS